MSDGFNELTELKAVARKHGEVVLTHTGRLLARIPIDVRLGRMVIEAAKSTTPNTLAAVLVVVAFLSCRIRANVPTRTVRRRIGSTTGMRTRPVIPDRVELVGSRVPS